MNRIGNNKKKVKNTKPSNGFYAKKKREKKELGIHSIRGGTIVGEHSVIFAGPEEVITVSHSAESRNVFAQGAVAAAKYLNGKPAGLYNMQDLIGQ